jgi:hypothetical protein
VPAGQGHQLVRNLALAHPLRTGIFSGHFLRHRPALIKSSIDQAYPMPGPESTIQAEVFK